MARRYWLKINGRKHFGTLAEVRQVGQRIADQFGQTVQVGYDDAKTKRATSRRYSRNPLMGGHDFTGEEWVIKGIMPNGSHATIYANSKAEAERELDYARRIYKLRATTLRRSRAPVSASKRGKA